MNFFQKRTLNALRKKVEKCHLLREQQSTNANVQNEINAHYQLAEFYKKHRFDKDLPYADAYRVECYRVAASLGEAKAQYLCGEALLEQAKFWEKLSHHPIYAADVHKKYADKLYEEAFVYLRSAQHSEYPFATRLLGLATIYGWGIPKNLDQGFKLILESIDQEKAWDRATKIFDDLKLNSPEFFQALRNYKGQPPQ
jgi:TPR repeat protein